MSHPLTQSIPSRWVSALRPYMQRAEEFDSREPVVAYFLRNYAAFLGMKSRKKEDREGTQYLMKLIESLENDKKRLSDDLSNIDGRTVLTKFGLMLFAKADDEERRGMANLNIVRLFFTASILFEATAQFTDDGELDGIAMEKRNYARYIAVRMKKALDSGLVYESPNITESSPNADDNEETETNGAGQTLSTQPPSSFLPRAPPNAAAVHSGGNDHPASGFATTSPINQIKGNPHADAPPDYTPPPSYTPPPYQPPPSMPTTTTTATATTGAPAPRNNNHHNSTTNNVPQPSSTESAGTPSIDAMINAQKFAKQAVSALQFYDHVSARKQLLTALNLLDGK